MKPVIRTRQSTDREEANKKENPIISVLGVFENNPEFDALVEDIHEYRKQVVLEEASCDALK